MGGLSEGELAFFCPLLSCFLSLSPVSPFCFCFVVSRAQIPNLHVSLEGWDGWISTDGMDSRSIGIAVFVFSSTCLRAVDYCGLSSWLAVRWIGMGCVVGVP